MTHTLGIKLRDLRLNRKLTPEALVAEVQKRMCDLKGLSNELTFRTYERMEREGYLPKKDGGLYLDYISQVLECRIEDIAIDINQAA